MSGALNSVFGGGLGQIAMSIAGTVFPPLGIAQAASSLLTGAMGQGLTQGLGQLVEQFGMPKFIGEALKDIVKDVVGQLTQGGNKECEEHVRDRCGTQVDDFASKFRDNFVKNCVENMREEKSCGKGKGGSGSWFEAAAQALGKSLDAQADEVKKLSSEITDENAKDKPSTMLDLQTASQRLAFEMSAASKFVESVGQALEKGIGK